MRIAQPTGEQFEDSITKSLSRAPNCRFASDHSTDKTANPV